MTRPFHPEGWRAGLPYVDVDLEVVRKLGTPTVDYEGLDILYRGELGLQTGQIPYLNFTPLNSFADFFTSVRHGVYRRRPVPICYVDPVSFLFDNDRSRSVIEAIAHEAKHYRNYLHNPEDVRTRRDEQKTLEFAANVRESGAYDHIIQFPRYQADAITT